MFASLRYLPQLRHLRLAAPLHVFNPTSYDAAPDVRQLFSLESASLERLEAQLAILTDSGLQLAGLSALQHCDLQLMPTARQYESPEPAVLSVMISSFTCQGYMTKLTL